MNPVFEHFYKMRLGEQIDAAPMPPEMSGDAPPPPPKEEAPVDAAPAAEPPIEPSAEPPVGSVPEPSMEEPPKKETDVFSGYISEYLKTISKYPSDASLARDCLEVARKLENLSPFQRNFVEMNWSAVSLLDDQAIVSAQKQIRRQDNIEMAIREAESQIQVSPELMAAVERLANMGPDKCNMWRQLLTALFAGAIVPGPVGAEVQILLGKGDSNPIVLRPQAYASWGMVDLGPVELTGSSTQEYLGEDEQQRLAEGAPEEKRVVRNRLFIEALSAQLAGGTYYIVVINPQDGSYQTCSFDSGLFREAYEGGKITVIEAAPEPTGQLAIDADGAFCTIAQWGLALIDDSSENLDPTTGERLASKEPVAKIDGSRLIFTGTSEQLGKMGADIRPYLWTTGNIERLQQIQRSIPSAREKLMGAAQ